MTETDKDVAAAWRAANREEPPPALDEAIRAAARREVGARPRRARGTPAWWPLAAAATVAVVAIGIVEMTPTERVSPEIAADMRSAPIANKAEPAEPSPQRNAIAESDRNAPASALADKPAKPQASARALRKENAAPPPVEERTPAASRERADTARQASVERGFAQPTEGERKQKTELANAPATAAPSSADASSAGRSVPFPGASAPRDKLDAHAQAAAAAPPVAPESPSAPPALASPSQPAAPAGVPSAGALAPNAPAPAEKRMAMAKTAAQETKREADAQHRPVDEWIKLMRRLIAEGKPAEAAKELAAFRAAYKERADALLPSDLREFKP